MFLSTTAVLLSHPTGGGGRLGSSYRFHLKHQCFDKHMMIYYYFNWFFLLKAKWKVAD